MSAKDNSEIPGIPNIPELGRLPVGDDPPVTHPRLQAEFVPDPDDLDDEMVASLLANIGGTYIPAWHIVNPPPHRHLEFICQRDVNDGLFTIGFKIYTREQYEEDQRLYRTQLSAPPRFEDGRCWVKKHWLVWVPQRVWDLKLAKDAHALAAMRSQKASFKSSGRGEEVAQSSRVIVRGRVVEAEGGGEGLVE